MSSHMDLLTGLESGPQTPRLANQKEVGRAQFPSLNKKLKVQHVSLPFFEVLALAWLKINHLLC